MELAWIVNRPDMWANVWNWIHDYVHSSAVHNPCLAVSTDNRTESKMYNNVPGKC